MDGVVGPAFTLHEHWKRELHMGRRYITGYECKIIE